MIKKEKIKDLHYSVSGVISADELQRAADEILTEYGKTAKMPGFRAGHIPLNVLRQKFNNNATADAIDKLMNRDLNAYLADKKIRLSGAPRADLPKWSMGADAEYTLEFDILPELPEFDLEKKYGPLMEKYQGRAQMAQSEADREYEQRIIEYIQRLYQAENELIEKQLRIMQQNQQASEKGSNSTDKISNLKTAAKAATDKYDKSKDKLDKMVKERKKQQENMKKAGQVDKAEDKKEDNKEKKKDKKTLDIGGLKNADNSKLDAGDLKDKKEEKKKSFLGL